MGITDNPEIQNFYLQKALEFGKLGYFTYNPRTRGFEGSDEMYDIFGVKPADAVEETFAKVIVPEDWPHLRAQFLACAAEHIPFDGRYRIRGPDGSLTFLLTRGKMVDTPDGPRLFGVVQDVTRQVQAEEQVRQIEDRFRVALENVPDPLMFHAEDGEVLTLSRAWVALTGYSKADIPTISEWAKKAYGPQVERILAEIRKTYSLTNQEEMGEYPIICRDGSVRIWDFCVAPVGRLADGRRATVSMARDVTEHRKAEAALKESEYFFRESQKAASIGSFKADFLHNRWESSEVLDLIFGIDADYNHDIFPGWTDLIHPEDRTMMEQYLQNDVVEKHRPFSKEYRILRKNDLETRWVNGLGQVTFDDNGYLISMIGTIQDITERKMTESLLLNTQKLEALGILAGGIAHDFNNLMGGIFGNINLAGLKSKDPDVDRFLSKALDTIGRARGLTQQLLTFAKGGAPVQQVAQLFPLVRETVEFALSGSHVTCSYVVAPDLWPCSFDRNQIGQVVDNLVINALQAMPQGGKLVVDARNAVTAEGDFVKVSVRDTGVGIPPDQVHRIFDPFFTTKTQGHGLGLATCHSIIRRHGGMITVESVPGVGTSFHIYLPRASGPPAAPDLGGSFPIFRGVGTAVVMDDEAVIRDILNEMLSNLGFAVKLYENGRGVLDYLEAENRIGAPPTVLIFDLTVPDGPGGKDIIDRVRDLAPVTPVIVTSGYADDPVMARPTEFGFTASLRKPFQQGELEQILRSVMTRKP